MQSGATAQKALTDWLGMENNTQIVCPWDGTDNKTLRNYAMNYTDVSMCFEGSSYCAYFSNDTTNKHNTIARAVMNTIYQMFVCKLSENWM